MTPWLEYGMTETEWHRYLDEYADWLDSVKDALCQ